MPNRKIFTALRRRAHSGSPYDRSLREAAADCRACDLWKLGTQTVFGEGRRRSVVMFIGEQPGNEEDLTGKPFVGPGGKLLDAALEEAGIDRSRSSIIHPSGARRRNQATGTSPLH